MTQARKLKKRIRARARKTGERYSVARRQLLKQKPPAPEIPASLRERDAGLAAKTGHGFAHWFAVLDAFGAVAKGHPASARHLVEKHGVDGWYAQEITVSYERARGLRAPNQRLSGEYEVSVSKVLPASLAEVLAAVRNPRRRAVWAEGMDGDLRLGLEAGLLGPKGLRERPQGGARMRFRTPAGVSVALYVDPKAKDRSSFVAQNMKLRKPEDIERYRAAWRSALESFGRYLK
jgi:hypothetical protein